MSLAFLDSNILIYAFNLDDERNAGARRVLEAGGVISAQCLNEFVAVARRRLGMNWDRITAARDVIVELCRPVLPVTLDLHRHGVELAERYRLSIYDGMIVAAALSGKCDILYSADMHAGLVIAGRLTIRNPFV